MKKIIITVIALSIIITSLGLFLFNYNIVFETVTTGEKMQECLDEGGEFRLYYHDWDDEYMAYCEIPEKKLWDIKVDT